MSCEVSAFCGSSGCIFTFLSFLFFLHMECGTHPSTCGHRHPASLGEELGERTLTEVWWVVSEVLRLIQALIDDSMGFVVVNLFLPR